MSLAAIRALEKARAEYGPGAERKKRALMRRLEGTALRRTPDLLALHETALFIRAFPDSPAVLALAERSLRAFADRVEALGPSRREALDETGVAGSSMHVSMALPLVRALSARHPRTLDVFVEGEGVEDKLETALRELLSPAELEAFADGYMGTTEWIERTRTTRSRNLLDRILALLDGRIASERERSIAWSMLDLPITWSLARRGGSRTLARAPAPRRIYQTQPFARTRQDVLEAIAEGPIRARRADRREARDWIAAAQHSVTARLREMHTFNHASEDDVVSADLGGVNIGVMGVLPEARHPLRAFFGYVLARNGVPIGYGDFVLLFGWGEVNFHIFESFRQAESSRIYAALVRFAHHHFGLEYLFLNRYQFGFHNEEAISTGAFWFYEKLGFRPTDPSAAAIWQKEKRAIEADEAHRTSRADLRRLARAHMHLVLARQDRGPVARRYAGFHPMNLALAVSRRIESHFGGDRRAAEEHATARVRRMIPASRRSETGLSRLAPFLDLIPDLERHAPRARSEVLRIVRAKEDRRELDYLRATQESALISDALVSLGRRG
jgi:hypothetical protein